MQPEQRKLVMRARTKYLEERRGRTRGTGFIDDLQTNLEEYGEKTVLKKRVRIYDITVNEEIEIAERLFHHGESFRNLKWKRNSKIAFDGTVYILEKCKRKNDQKPGPKVAYEIRNPRNVEVIEFETNNKYRPKRKKRNQRWNRKARERARRRSVKALEQEDETERVSSDEKKYRQLMKKEWQSLRRQRRHATIKEIEERIKERGQ